MLLMASLCLHCRKNKGTRARGLCWVCHADREVRGRYGAGGRVGAGVENSVGPLPLLPTPARPGTPEKLAVLIARAERGQRLWHPLDARMG